MTNDRPTVISIFSGAGGIDIGFNCAGFDTIYATDSWDTACETLDANRLAIEVEQSDIQNLGFDRFNRDNLGVTVDCLVGGPPCPPYSKSRFYLKDKPRALNDEQSLTLREYFRAVEEIRPLTFFFENVHGFVYKPHRASFDYLRARSEDLGYNLTWRVVNCADYGVPQIRQRFICVGTRTDISPFEFPNYTNIAPDQDIEIQTEKFDAPNQARLFNEILESCGETSSRWITCQDAIGELDYPLPEDAKSQAGSKHKHLLQLIPPGDNYLYLTAKRGYPDPQFVWRSRYWSFLLKLSPERPSWTIQASFSNNMGPFHWTNRFLRISEIKRLQTFPDGYQLMGKMRDQWRLVGNAVPPRLSYVIAKQIRKILPNSDRATSKHPLSIDWRDPGHQEIIDISPGSLTPWSTP